MTEEKQMTRLEAMINKFADETGNVMAELDNYQRPIRQYIDLARDYYLTLYAVRIIQAQTCRKMQKSSVDDEDITHGQ